MSRKYIVLAVACAIASGYLLFTAFRRGWTQVETDFPNYYTAAALTLRHAPLERFYEWTWFQRQMNYTGTERQLGAYMPFPPLTMMPLLPLAPLEPQHAKQVWLILSVLLFAACIPMLARLSGLHATVVLGLGLLAWAAVAENLLYGQYYLFLLFPMTAGVWYLLRGRPIAAGALLGVVFALKLYTAPFLFYFAIRRQWRALASMLAAIAALTLASMAIFGFHAVWFFGTTVMVRGLDGSVVDPYNAGFSSMIALLRHLYIAEAELNPHPLFDAPPGFFFLRSFYAIGMLAFSLLALRNCRSEARALAVFAIVLLALSPEPATYHFILLLIPVALLLPGESVAWGAGLVTLYALVALPLYEWDMPYFPRAWILLGMFFYAGWRYLKTIPLRTALAALTIVTAFSAVDAWRRTDAYRSESTRITSRPVVAPDNIFAGSPAIAGGQIVYEAIAQERYLLRSFNGAATREFAFEGEAFHPAVAQPGGPIFFELVAQRHSRICRFDPSRQTLDVIVGPELDPTEPAVSRDGTSLAFVSRGALYVRDAGGPRQVLDSSWISGPAFFADGRIAFAEGPPGNRSVYALTPSGSKTPLVTGEDSLAPAISPNDNLLAYVVAGTGNRQIWIMNLATHAKWRLTAGACTNEAPAWRSDSRSVVFTSDCDRGLGLPALFSLPVEQH